MWRRSRWCGARLGLCPAGWIAVVVVTVLLSSLAGWRWGGAVWALLPVLVPVMWVRTRPASDATPHGHEAPAGRSRPRAKS
jgi:hypothetical protein